MVLVGVGGEGYGLEEPSVYIGWERGGVEGVPTTGRLNGKGGWVRGGGGRYKAGGCAPEGFRAEVSGDSPFSSGLVSACDLPAAVAPSAAAVAPACYHEPA